MVVKFKMVYKFFILACVVLLFSCSSHAKEDAVTSYQLSLLAFKEDKAQLERVINQCNGRKVIVKRSLLEPFNIREDELKTALFFLNSVAESRCENGFREKLFYSAAIHRQVSQFYNKNPGDAENYTEELMLAVERRKLDFKAKYLLIDKALRGELEKIQALQVPFLILETLDQF